MSHEDPYWWREREGVLQSRIDECMDTIATLTRERDRIQAEVERFRVEARESGAQAARAVREADVLRGDLATARAEAREADAQVAQLRAALGQEHTDVHHRYRSEDGRIETCAGVEGGPCLGHAALATTDPSGVAAIREAIDAIQQIIRAPEPDKEWVRLARANRALRDRFGTPGRGEK